MFDIGFWELAIIGVVALLVIGPERLPRVARTTGLWLGRARRFVSSVKADIDREIAADELKKALAKQAESPALHDIIEDTKKTIQDAGEALAEPVPTPAEEEHKAVTQKPNDASG
ncbi:MAG: Sec-independent protein translocase protein TatB [Thiogranum sp.]